MHAVGHHPHHAGLENVPGRDLAISSTHVSRILPAKGRGIPLRFLVYNRAAG